VSKKDKEYIENIILNGSAEDKRALYAFSIKDDIKIIAKKFNLFVVGNYDRYYTHKPAPFHAEMIENYIKAFKGDINFLNIGFRGCAKTSLMKLFITFILLNDVDTTKKFIKILTKEQRGSNQLVVDVYNMIVEVAWLYGDVFQKEGKIKREETMSSFTMRDGRKVLGGTVGQLQRGQVADASRPDFIWFEDLEDSESKKSLVKTQTIIDKSDEAIQGLDVNGSFVVTANYISDVGVIEWFIIKESIHTQITPIIDDNYLSTWGDRYSQDKILKIKKDASDWEGDYMCSPEASDSIFFDRELVDEKLKEVKKPIKKVGLVDVYAEYKPHHVYVVGGDTSEGVNLDSNALTVIDLTKNKIVATFTSNKIAPDLFGYEMCNIGEYYGNCLLVPEINNTGHATLTAIKERGYTRVYAQERTDKRTNEKTEMLGWRTTNKTKHNMWFNFKKEFEDDEINIPCRDLLMEIRQYTREDFMGGTTGVITRHFDLLTSLVIAWAGREQAYFKKHRKIARRKVKNNVIGL